jgi:RimJ/RimL family protein N-acetyltransferase
VPELRTARLLLRPLHVDDTEAVVRIFADPELSRFLGCDLTDPEQARAMMTRRLTGRFPPGMGHWALVRDGAVIGLAHLRPSWELPGSAGCTTSSCGCRTWRAPRRRWDGC